MAVDLSHKLGQTVTSDRDTRVILSDEGSCKDAIGVHFAAINGGLRSVTRVFRDRRMNRSRAKERIHWMSWVVL